MSEQQLMFENWAQYYLEKRNFNVKCKYVEILRIRSKLTKASLIFTICNSETKDSLTFQTQLNEFG